VSNKQAAASADVSLSPYLSFRQAIRPAIFANSLLLREQDRAGELADAANQILTLTRDLMRKAWLGYIATPEPGASAGAGNGIGRLDSLLDTFADAAMMWAQIVGGCLALADGLLDQGRLNEVQALAAVLDDSGESGTARQLRQRLAPAAMDIHKKRLGRIHAQMKPAEIEKAIDAFNAALTEIPQSPERDVWLDSFLPALAVSALLYIEEESSYALQYIADGGRMSYPSIAATSLSEIAAAFRAANLRSQ
jgi:hypothetical protein